MKPRLFAPLIAPLLALTGCGMVPATVRDGCYRFDDGAPLFTVTGGRATIVAKGARVRKFRIGGWHELARRSVEIVPAFYLPGLPAGDPRRGDAMPIPSIGYSTFAFDSAHDTFKVPVAAWGEQQVRLGPPC